MLGEPEADRRLLRKHRPVLDPDEIDPRVGRRRLAHRRIDHPHLDLGRHDRRRVRNVILVAEQQLERVLAVLEGDLGLGLAAAEVEMVEVVGDRLIERRQIGIDQQMVMA